MFPSYRLAYTEKTIQIHNTLQPSQWNSSQEALYTFYLPEGSVITSAALWINGEERPAYLTTKEKADSAYTAIVGTERRDPLLVHWQEGNRVSVRIFPCLPEEDRQFKIGITSPLFYTPDQRLQYRNIDFVGPDWKKARERIQIRSTDFPEALKASLHFERDVQLLTYEGKYRSDWTVAFNAPALSSLAFTFRGYSYKMTELTEGKADWQAQEIYLDINGAWSKKTLFALWEAIKDREVYAYTDRLVKVTDGNHRDLFGLLLKRNYGLFPLHEIGPGERALLITASGPVTPTLDDLSGSRFAEKLNAYMQSGPKPLRVFHFGAELSPYWRSLRELRLINYAYGGQEELLTILQANQFPQRRENPQLIENIYSHCAIERTEGESPATGAPDHLMRLFVYNDLMRQIGKSYFERAEQAPELVAMAKEAYVLSPISSLIVLETQEDYDRFDIERSKNSLENASFTASGSVPEPHEWLLICFSLLIAAYLWYQQKRGDGSYTQY